MFAHTHTHTYTHTHTHTHTDMHTHTVSWDKRFSKEPGQDFYWKLIKEDWPIVLQ